MPPSQLKRLKASLRENGITGPPKPASGTKTKKMHGARKSGGGDDDEAALTRTRVARAAALTRIRTALNPFDVKRAARPGKRDVTTLANRGASGSGVVVLGRPGVTRGAGEEARRRTLLRELQSRNKVGGIVDRRIGEADARLTAEERGMKRFEREVVGARARKGNSVFDLEGEEDEEEDVLTHGGKALALDAEVDDFDAGSLEGEEDGDEEGTAKPSKRRRELELGVDTEEAELPARKKSKAETIKEIVMKDRLRKYEVQMAKEADEELREELDKGLGDLQEALASFSRKAAKKQEAQPTANGEAKVVMDSERAALMNLSDKDYEKRLREIALDRRSKPSERTKTDEERAKEEAERLKELEEKRLRRMRGEDEVSEAEEAEPAQEPNGAEEDAYQLPDDAADFGFKAPRLMERPPGFEDEDEFIVEDDLIASDSEVEEESISVSTDASSDGEESDLSDELLALQGKSSEDTLGDGQIGSDKESTIAFTYECPRSLEQLQVTFDSVPFDQIPEVIRRIRLLYDPSIAKDNKEKLADFAQALVAYIAVPPATANAHARLRVTEQIIRHLHSMSRTFAMQIAVAFREQLEGMHRRQTMHAGDLTVLTAIGTIYPTSDHFHQVVTPAITIMARWLGLSSPHTVQDLNTGAYLVTLALKHQSLSKRYIPEAVRFTISALKSQHPKDLLQPHISNLRTMADMWSSKSAFIEIFTPAAAKALHGLRLTKELQHLTLLVEAARRQRRPLALHNHRPQPIKAAVPKFEEDFNPDKHYDPDRERAEAARLRKEYKRERKGALRELRKDANFLAREKLREKKERDKAYEEKYRKLVASIQGEEGAEKNRYEREKRLRKGKR